MRRALIATTLMIAACGPILGIQDLDTEQTAVSAPPRPDADAEDDPPAIVDGGGVASDAGDADGAPGDKRVFVTSDTTDGNFGGVAGAAALCAAAADREKLGGTWTAWLSEPGAKVVERLPDTRYVLLDGVEVASGLDQLRSGTLSAAIFLTETGEAAAAPSDVWTGTGPDGSGHGHCDSWSTNNPGIGGSTGLLHSTDASWTDTNPGAAFVTSCSTPAHLYCFEL